MTARRHVDAMTTRGIIRMRTVVEPSVIGDRNLCGAIAVAGDRALSELLAETVGTLPGLLHAEVTTELRSIKRASWIQPDAI